MFNLSKLSQAGGETPQMPTLVNDEANEISQGIENPDASDASNTESKSDEVFGDPKSFSPEQEHLLSLQQDQGLWQFLQEELMNLPKEAPGAKAINSLLKADPTAKRLRQEFESLQKGLEDNDLQGLASHIKTTTGYQQHRQQIMNSVHSLNEKIKQEQQQQQQPNFQFQPQQQRAAFNLKKVKAQMQEAMPPPQHPAMSPQPTQSRLPVRNEGDFIDKFLEPLMNNNNLPGTPEYEQARQAAEELRNTVSPGFEEEANSLIEFVMNLDPTQKEEGQRNLLKLYEVLLPPAVKQDSGMEPVMSEKENTQKIKQASNEARSIPKASLTEVEGIIRYSFTDQILTNAENMVKTAADQFGQQYLLYGPTEKRICPKLRGKNMSVGDVVSEYTCRHHCLDGIVIDDNKTICGEALWRANSMDKFSREYVDADGNTVGGYINKRFEVNRNVPEENKMRLKPGELRKPRPAAWGNTESRLQDMRAKEAQKRDYRPDSNTGDPFNWSKDVDQNNVQVSQKDRDQRETKSGHELVEYTNRNDSENKPKIAFNLSKMNKTAQFPMENPCPMCGGNGESMGTLGTKEHFRCRDCGMDFSNEDQGRGGEVCRRCEKSDYPVEAHYDARGIYITKCCDKCWKEVSKGYRQDVLEDPGYEADEPFEPEPMLKPMMNPMASNEARSNALLKTAQSPPFEQTKYDFQEGERRARNMTDSELHYAILDLKKTIAIQEQTNQMSQTDPTVNAPHKLGYYWDELHTYTQELRNRQQHGRAAFNLKTHKIAGIADISKKKN